jgi:hypothetical protein
MVLKDGVEDVEIEGQLVGAIEMADKYGCDTGRCTRFSPRRRKKIWSGASRESKAPRAF